MTDRERRRKRLLTAGMVGWGASVAFAAATMAAAFDDGRILRKEVVVQATPEDVWQVWTTSEGMADFWIENTNIELRVGGPYEIFIVPDAPPGQPGCDDCRVLSYLPYEMFSFEWNFPPSIASLRQAGAKTHVVLQFDEVAPGRTRVRLSQLGWQAGDDWDQGYAYFDRAWSNVLKLLQSHFAEAPAAGDSDSWIEGNVTVMELTKPVREQVFEVTLPVSRAYAWRALTTVKGLKEFIAPDPKVELAVGGVYEIFEGTGTHVQAYVPFEALAVTGSAPLEFPNVRMGGTWALLEFDALGENESRVRMSVYGWQEGDEWQRAFEYFLKNNAVFLNLLHQRFTEGPLKWSKALGAKHATHKRQAYKPLAALPEAPSETALRTSAAIGAPRDKVWEALTSTDALRQWSDSQAGIELKIGGSLRFDSGGGLEILSYAPPRMLAHRPWNATADQDAGVMWRLVELEGDATGILVDIVGLGADGGAAKAQAHVLLAKLKQHLEPK